MTDLLKTPHPDQKPDSPALAAKPAAAMDAWHGLRRYTPARIALGRIGASLPTTEVLAFSMAHARARDAVHLNFDADALASSLEQAGFQTLRTRSRAEGRSEYLRRPDLGRQLHPDCKAQLLTAEAAPAHRLTAVVGDGLSSLAPARHALPLLIELRAQLERVSAWLLDSIVIASEARVALADEVGELRGAEAVVMLLGERPGLSSPDSLGIYLTYAPRRGRSDAERNCLSNIRHEGLSYAEAAYKLLYLLDQARSAGASGVVIKDSSEWSASTSLPTSVPGSKQLSS
jgi:ethanolamine ammonia-lyase small subunit